MASAERTRRCFSCGVKLYFMFMLSMLVLPSYTMVLRLVGDVLCVILDYHQLLYSILVLLEESGNYFGINNVIFHV